MQQESLLNESIKQQECGPVECLGQIFENDEARRTHYTELLLEKLKEPDFKKIEGFPLGTDEAILELSDPPYYTACPNPWLNDFVEYWESQKESSKEEYHREPFATDVSEGKSDPIYNAHSYHTKVPHKAIMRYILHYTNPGDIVFDGFCGSGMTGVASQLCGDRATIESLGYRVLSNGIIQQNVEDYRNNNKWVDFSKLGARNPILCDLSSAAGFISNSYNSPRDCGEYLAKIDNTISSASKKFEWLYTTLHKPTKNDIHVASKLLNNFDNPDNYPKIKKAGLINYLIWSDAFTCPDCSKEIIFWESAVDLNKGKVKDSFHCNHCNTSVTKKSLEKIWVSKFDETSQKVIQEAKQVPVYINYSVDNKRFEKVPDEFDLLLIDHISNLKNDFWFPSDLLPKGSNTSQPIKSHGCENVHQFYTSRSRLILSNLRSHGLSTWAPFNALTPRATRLHRIAASRLGGDKKGVGGATVGVLNGTLYLPSLSVEMNVLEQAKVRIKVFKKAQYQRRCSVISNQSTTNISQLPNNSVDYVFIDPPFGANINYSELSFLWEAWLKVWTNNKKEAIENKTQNKTTDDYRHLMLSCFQEVYRILKPGKWITIEFSNTKATIWNSIQTALNDSGFIVANVSALDKKQGSFKAVTTTTAVKQDLVISAYKPDLEFEKRFIKEASTTDGVWDFIKTHLEYLTVVKVNENEIISIPERDPRILFDQLVSYYVRQNTSVPLSSQEFQLGLKQRFPERDGMIFLPEQVVEYDKRRAISSQIKQLSIFVDDEASAIEWMRKELKDKPKTYSDIHPLFLNQLSGWKKNELQLELSTLLEQNFIKYDGNEDVPNQIHTYLSTNFKEMRSLPKDSEILIAKAKDRWFVPDPNKAGDIEKLRLRALLREFEAYKEEKKKIKQPRAEALRAGFNRCTESQNYQVILDIAKKIPAAVLQEDSKLLMFYDNALTLTSNQDDDWD